jgi:hypothetical protein
MRGQNKSGQHKVNVFENIMIAAKEIINWGIFFAFFFYFK